MRATSLTAGPITHEVETVCSSNIAIQHFAQMPGEIDTSNPLARGTARSVHSVNRCHRFGRCVERPRQVSCCRTHPSNRKIASMPSPSEL